MVKSLCPVQNEVWYFDVTQSIRLTRYLADSENPVPVRCLLRIWLDMSLDFLGALRPLPV